MCEVKAKYFFIIWLGCEFQKGGDYNTKPKDFKVDITIVNFGFTIALKSPIVSSFFGVNNYKATAPFQLKDDFDHSLYQYFCIICGKYINIEYDDLPKTKKPYENISCPFCKSKKSSHLLKQTKENYEHASNGDIGMQWPVEIFDKLTKLPVRHSPQLNLVSDKMNSLLEDIGKQAEIDMTNTLLGKDVLDGHN